MTQRVAVGLTLVNAVVLVVLLSQMETLAAQSAPGVLRGSGLEIVDRHGKVRASITIYPETPAAASRPAYPEVVVLRLIDRNGKPMMKLDTREAARESRREPRCSCSVVRTTCRRAWTRQMPRPGWS